MGNNWDSSPQEPRDLLGNKIAKKPIIGYATISSAAEKNTQGGEKMDIKEAGKFLSEHHEGVLVTRKKDGRLQMSPVTPGVDKEGNVIISTRETAYKTRNIRRDPRVSLCVFTEAFIGPWIRLDGSATVQSLPEAMDPLIYWHRQIKGDHPNWAEYQDKMNREKRVMVRIAIERVGPERKG